MTRLDDCWPSFVFSCDRRDKFDANLGKIPFGPKVLDGTKSEVGMLTTILKYGQMLIPKSTHVIS